MKISSILTRLAAPVVTAIVSLLPLASCESTSEWDQYFEWRNDNYEWYLQCKNKTNPDGTPYYTMLSPDWYPESGVLIHYFNDRRLTAGNLSPMMTSTVDMVYIGTLYNDSIFDSSYSNTQYGDSIFRTQANAVIDGWQIALNDMHVGDTCEVIIPYPQAYGDVGQGQILPYSTLRFNMKLVAIPAYEIPEAAIQ